MNRKQFSNKLNKLWSKNHFEHLTKCFKEYKEYYEGSFDTLAMTDETIIANRKVFTPLEIKSIITDYYSNDTKNYHSCFGDVVWMFLTDFTQEHTNIIKEIEND